MTYWSRPTNQSAGQRIEMGYLPRVMLRVYTKTQTKFQKISLQNEAKCETFVVKMSFICITDASLWKWDFLELGNGLHSTRQSGSLKMHLTSFCANLTASVVIQSLLAETGYRRFSRISNPEIQFYWELQKYGLLGQSPASGPEVVPGSWKNHPFTPFPALLFQAFLLVRLSTWQEA